jgi:hypothetical protein
MSLLSPWTPSTPSFRESPSLDLSVYTPSPSFPYRGRVLELALDKEGSHVLQRLVSDASSGVIDLVLAELLAELPRVMCDTYGNYFTQQLFQVASLNNRVDCWRRLRHGPSSAVSPLSSLSCFSSLSPLTPSTPSSFSLLLDSPVTPTSASTCRTLFASPLPLRRPLSDGDALHGGVAIDSYVADVPYAKAASSASDAFATVACDRRGTHSLQALISQSSDAAEFRAMAACLTTNLVGSLATDQNGTHVVQQMVEVVSSRSPLANIIFDEVVDNFPALPMSQFGLGLVKRCIGYADVRGYGAKIAAKLEQHLAVLIEDAFGNYAVQHALDVWSQKGSEVVLGSYDLKGAATSGGGSALYASAKRMVQRISERVVVYAQHKFASNVVEIAIKVAEPQMRWKLISQFTVVRGEEGEFYGALLRSPFAVFVVATALKFASDQRQAKRLAEKFALYLNAATKTRAKWAKTLAPYLAEKKVDEGSSKWFMPPEVNEPTGVHAGVIISPSFYY